MTPEEVRAIVREELAEQAEIQYLDIQFATSPSVDFEQLHSVISAVSRDMLGWMTNS
ncbi:hypothetical protein I5I01_gp56 [Mycobacterium phage MooMoo]|uniref:Uncharacterized protein n=1 Tax=Mycobacterium phage MooMoo TaxID=2108127 RepID=A0A2P1JRB2_9CAUD|nr:hypothetical protein I5I01_gp56 [Mycobacterium phage MooMoo]AVO21661.1 hypothetical protein SEA_MOOMOO_56 [Mycobacterium phage MooMoo]